MMMIAGRINFPKLRPCIHTYYMKGPDLHAPCGGLEYCCCTYRYIYIYFNKLMYMYRYTRASDKSVNWF